MTKQEEITKETFREAFEADSLYTIGRMYYPVNLEMWNTLLGYYTEERLTQMGFLKTDYLEVWDGN